MHLRLSKDVREIVAGAIILFAIVTTAFGPFAYGAGTLMSSAEEVPSIFATGGEPTPAGTGYLKILDPGAAAWQTEPELFLEHDLVRNEHVAPLWNPYVAYGQPLAADMLSQPFYPLTWIVVADRSTRAYDWFIILRLYVAGLFAFLFLRLFVRFVAALAGAIGFTFTGYFLLYFNIAHISVECLIPALLWAMELLARRRDDAGVVRVAIIDALVVFGGMPESALLAFVLAYGYFCVRVVSDPLARPTWRIALASIVGASALGIGMSACLLLPFAEFIKLSINSHEARFAGVLVGTSHDDFDITLLGSYLLPLLYGAPYNNVFPGQVWTGIRGFFGIAEAFCALVAVSNAVISFARRHRRTWSPIAYFAFATALLLCKRFGSWIDNWIGALPGLSLILFPKYDEPLIGFCVAALAAFGIEILAARKARPVDVGIAATLLLVVLTVIAGFQRPVAAAVPTQWPYVVSLAYGLVLLGALAALAWMACRTEDDNVAFRAASTLAVLLVTESLGSYFIPMWYFVTSPAPIGRSPIRGSAYIDAVRRESAVSHERFYGQDEILYPEWSSAFAISDVEDLNAIYTFRYLTFLNALLEPALGPVIGGRFVGPDLDPQNPMELRFLQLSSIGYIGTAHPLDDDPSLLSLNLVEHPELTDASLHHGTFYLDNAPRWAVFMRPPRIRFPVTAVVPSGATTLRYSVGLDPQGWSPSAAVCGDGVTFAVELRDARGRISTLARTFVDPRHNVRDRYWKSVSVPVREWAGKPIQLLFSTLPDTRPGSCSSWSLWSDVAFSGPLDRASASPLRLIYSSPAVQVYHYADTLPRLAVYDRFVSAPSDDGALQILTSPAFDPFRQAVVTAQDADSLGFPSDQSTGDRVAAGRIDTYLSEDVRGTIDAKHRSLVVLNDTYYPGWIATVDGKPSDILLADYMFRGIVVPPGHHTVEFRYEPASFRLGLYITIASIVMAVLYLGFRRGAARMP